MTDERFTAAQAVADAVLYEGYVLYPYRASSTKNHMRWQFGVLVPPDFEAGDEPNAQQTESLLELGGDVADRASVQVRLRFLQAQARRVEQALGNGFVAVTSLRVDDVDVIEWDEAVQQQVDVSIRPGDILDRERVASFTIPGAHEIEEVRDSHGRVAGRIRRERADLTGLLRLRSEQLDPDTGALRLRIVTENTTTFPDSETASRDDALRRSLIGTHTLLAAANAEFVSMLEPPPWAEMHVESSHQVNTFPVLVGDGTTRDTVLSSPILLYDWPRVAPESQGDFFDATEIDELLTLRTLTLTDAEKREARGTDARSAAIVDRVEATSPEAMRALHGAIRSERELPHVVSTPDAVIDDSRPVVGSRVRLHPRGRADAQDMFVDGRIALVEKITTDVDGRVFVAVTVEDDPAADLHRWFDRYLYFSSDEVEPVETTESVIR